jgi:hypothetical protein
MDITELILAQHHEQRRAFAMLDDIPLDDGERLGAVWSRLEVLLEVHAKAEEEFFYPRLLRLATGAGGLEVEGEVKDAVKDHNEIRDGIRKVRKCEPGTEEWWAAVKETRVANSDHMAEEEREDLPEFRRRSDLRTRHDVAVQFITYEAQHPAGIVPQDRDPDTFVVQNS